MNLALAPTTLVCEPGPRELGRRERCRGSLFTAWRCAGISARQPSSFSCLPKKRNQKKGTRRLRPLAFARGFAAVLGARGDRKNSPLGTGAQTVCGRRLRRCPRTPALLAASNGKHSARLRIASVGSLRFALGTRFQATRSEHSEAMRSEPSGNSRWMRRGAQAGGVAARSAVERACLSPVPGASLRARPARRAPQRTPSAQAEEGAAAGSPFFASFLWRSKERRSAAGPKSRRSLTQ